MNNYYSAIQNLHFQAFSLDASLEAKISLQYLQFVLAQAVLIEKVELVGCDHCDIVLCLRATVTLPVQVVDVQFHKGLLSLLNLVQHDEIHVLKFKDNR